MFNFKERIRYFFDNTLSKGPLGLLIWLGLFVSIVIVLVSIFVWTSGVSSKDSLLEQIYLYLISSLGAADADTDGGWLFRSASMFVIFSGIFVMGALISILTTAVDTRLEKLRRGRSRIIESGHTVILGWSDEILVLIKELVIANENHPNSCIAILANEDKVEMEDKINEAIGPHKQTRIVFRSGNPMAIHDLNIVNINSAKSIIALGDKDDVSGLVIMKTVLAIINNPSRRVEPYHIVAAINNPKILDSIKLISEDEIEVINKGEFITKIEAQTLLQSGLSLVITDLLDFDGEEIYFKKEPELNGLSYREVVLSYDTSAIIGFYRDDGQILLNPPADSLLGEGDSIIAVSHDDDTVILSEQKYPEIDEDIISLVVPQPPKAKNILMLGWNQHSLKLVNHISDNTPKGSKIIIAASCSDSKAQVEKFSSKVNLTLEHIAIDPTERSHLEGLPFNSIDHVVILPCFDVAPNTEPLSINQLDASTLVTLLNVRRIRQQGGFSLTITSEILDIENRTLIETKDNDDFVVSDHLISLALAQISENKSLGPVFNSLFDPHGNEIYLKPASNYVKTGQPVSFFSVVESALRQNETAIGYRIKTQNNLDEHSNKEYDIVLNPDKRSVFEFSVEDKIVVLADDGGSSQ
jgi:ion channel POLLUX/CASTOR